MIKLLYLMRRREGLTPAEFQEHWLEIHARFGRDNPHVLRYVQYHTLLDDPIREALAQAGASEAPEAYDGLTVAWFADAAGLEASLAADGVAAALEDERRFIDHARSAVVLAHEHVHIEPTPPSPVVLVECLPRPAGIDRRTFSDRWLHHAEIAHKAHSLGLLSGYIQNHALLEEEAASQAPAVLGAGGESWDGIVTAYFQSVAAAKALFALPLASEEAYEDEKTFIDHARAVHMLTRRHVIKDLVR